jgi:hypothetical protein
MAALAMPLQAAAALLLLYGMGRLNMSRIV